MTGRNICSFSEHFFCYIWRRIHTVKCDGKNWTKTKFDETKIEIWKLLMWIYSIIQSTDEISEQIC